MAKAPNDRPADAETLIAMLDGIHFDSPWTPARARAWWDEHLPSTLPPTPIDNRMADRGEWIRFLKESRAP
jgi:hypothetical protein